MHKSTIFVSSSVECQSQYSVQLYSIFSKYTSHSIVEIDSKERKANVAFAGVTAAS